MIPKIIHQSFKTARHPYPLKWQQSWLDNHPKWEYHFHTDADNRRLVAKLCPQFLKAFDSFPRGIMRADFARFLYLYSWGGVYVDLDYVCLRPMDSLLRQVAKIGIPWLPGNGYYQYHNAILVSEARNPFWLTCAEQAVFYFWSSEFPQVEQLAGPLRIQAAIESEGLKFAPLLPKQVTPLDWFAYNVKVGKGDKRVAALRDSLSKASIAAIRNAFPQAYAVTFWNHGWRRGKDKAWPSTTED